MQFFHRICHMAIWGQKGNASRKQIFILQNKALKRIHFKPNDEHLNPLYHHSKILKLEDLVTMNNFLFAHDFYHSLLPTSLLNNFNLVKDMHNYNTRVSSLKFMTVPLVNSKKYGINSIRFQSISSWNMFTKLFKNIDLSISTKSQCKTIIKYIFYKSVFIKVAS